MSGTGAQMSWRECRAFLADLAQHGTRAAAGQRVPHTESCSACAALLHSAVAQIGILRALPRPVPPSELSSHRFLEGIYARAGESSETWLRPVLEAGLADHHHAVAAETDWLAADDPQEIAASLARSLPSGPTPGWLWTRIQAEMRTLIRGRRRARWARRVQVAGFLAAGLVISLVALRPFLVSEDEGAITVTFAPSSVPLDSSYSTTDLLRELGAPR